MNADQRAAARARRDEMAGMVLWVEPEATVPTATLDAILRDGSALDAALSSVERERDALKAAVEQVIGSLELRVMQIRARSGRVHIAHIQQMDIDADDIAHRANQLRSALVSVEEGTGHDGR